ncbi:DUF4342 domain-containing protein [Dendrosporobacter sp. 1207_IL3150]|uniref:DUF4342 domain-containing protein n=1 Tax=Dendrosporobacter sp. 1207_IL3150 TaxID=3084054 RepID=UPI002FDB6B5D
MEEITLEKIDIIRERIGVSYREAKEILERNNGNVIEALVDAETKKNNNWTEEFSVRSNEVIDKVKELIHEGNVNRIRIKSDGRTLVEIPVALGAIGAVVLPQLAALGVLVAVFKRCTIEVVRSGEESDDMQDSMSEHKAENDNNNKQY